MIRAALGRSTPFQIREAATVTAFRRTASDACPERVFAFFTAKDGLGVHSKGIADRAEELSIQRETSPGSLNFGEDRFDTFGSSEM